MRRRATRLIAFTLAVLLAVPAPLFALTRPEIISRAKRWVDLEVPYNQSGRFEGWRTDCSGMMSMSWKLWQPGYTSRTLAPFGVKISRDELQPGDMMLKYDYHAAVFYKWANSDHTWYWTLEQSGSAGKAVMRLTRYPYWDQAGFSAYRPRDYTEIDDYAPYINAISGSNRYATAILASRLAFASNSATTAVLCSGENWPDALGGSALAGAVDGPVLLTHPTALSSGVAGELARLGVSDVLLIGGESAMSANVATSVENLPGVSVRRIGAANRYATAAVVASETINALAARGRTHDGGFYLATGDSYPDALGAATVAAHTGRPILLSHQDSLPAPTEALISTLPTGTASAFIVGGTSAVGAPVSDVLTGMGIGAIQRFGGADRYVTSYLLAEHGVAEGLSWSNVALATGSGYADALAGAVAQAKRGSVLQLTPSNCLVPSADRAIRDNLAEIAVVTIYGGESAISRTARRQIRWMMNEP